jgi:hypothetical protein
MVKSTVNWINSGFQGSPAYATNLNQTLQQASDAVAQGFLNQMKSQLSINSPFRDSIAQNVLQNYYLSTSRDSFFLKNPYTLNQVSPNDIALNHGDLIQGGGFPAFLSEALNCSNNPICALNNAQNELNSRVASKQASINQELGWGNGFFSFRKCDTPAPASNSACGPGMVDTGDGSGCQPSGSVSLSNPPDCFSSHIETPGSVIAGQLNKSLGLGADSLVNAKEFDEIVNALLGQLMNNVVGSTGLGGLSRGSTATGGSTYFNQPTSNTSSGVSGGAAVSAGVTALNSFLQLLDGQTAQLQTYLTNWQTINTAAVAAKTALLSSTCMTGTDAIITSQVQPVITQAATAIGSVPTALATIDKIKNEALSASSLSASQQTAIIQQASVEYQNFLASNSLPDISSFTYASQQSVDTGTAVPASLLTQMNQLTAQARCGK